MSKTLDGPKAFGVVGVELPTAMVEDVEIVVCSQYRLLFAPAAATNNAY